jgi:uncharacterized SAM-binding protein YcdF (DUF218 family)
MKYMVRAAAIVLFVAMLRMFFFSGFSNNTVYLFLFTSAFIVYGIFFERLKKIRLLNILIIAAFLTYAGFSCFLGFYGMNDTVTYDEDAVIVLGCGIKGEEVSRLLKYRLEMALDYHKRNPEAIIFVSGGKGAGEDIPEALAMERWLTARGVPSSQIIREEYSYSTYENIQNTKRLLEDAGLLGGDAKLALITSEFHIYRGEWFANAAGLSVRHLHAPSSWYSVPVNFARECAAVVKMWVIGK